MCVVSLLTLTLHLKMQMTDDCFPIDWLTIDNDKRRQNFSLL